MFRRKEFGLESVIVLKESLMESVFHRTVFLDGVRVSP